MSRLKTLHKQFRVLCRFTDLKNAFDEERFGKLTLSRTELV